MISRQTKQFLILPLVAGLFLGCFGKPEAVPEPSPEQLRMQNQVRALANEMTRLKESQAEIEELKATIAVLDSQLIQYREEADRKDEEMAKPEPLISPQDPNIINLKGDILVLTREIDSLKHGMKILQGLADSLETKVTAPTVKEEVPTIVAREPEVIPAPKPVVEEKPTLQPEPQPKAPVQEATPPPLPPVQSVGYLHKADYQKAYTDALNAYFGKDFPAAIQQFQVLITREPQGTYADNSQYWIGECYYSLEDFGRAITEFRKVFTFPENNKSDHALFKIAMSYQQLGDNQRARETMNQFILDYPQSELIEQAHTFLSTAK